MKTALKISQQDLKYTLRQLRRSPAFSCIAVLTLALGIGATTAMFTIVQNVLLKPLRYSEPQQLVTIREKISTSRADFDDMPVNANHPIFWREHNRSFSEIAVFLPSSMPLGGDRTEEIDVAQETANLHSVLGASPRLGRSFTAEEEKPGYNAVILTDGLWRRRYEADPAIVGKTIPLNGMQYVVTGVLPSDFVLPNSRAIGGLIGTSRSIEAFVPFASTAEQLGEIEEGHNYFAIARLKPGVTTAQAASDLNSLQHDISRQTPDKITLTATVIPFQEYLVGSCRRALLMLLAAVSGILLIACINITTFC